MYHDFDVVHVAGELVTQAMVSAVIVLTCFSRNIQFPHDDVIK